MTIRTRKFFGTIALLVLVVVWSLLGMTIAQTPWLANSGLLQAIFYVVAGPRLGAAGDADHQLDVAAGPPGLEPDCPCVGPTGANVTPDSITRIMRSERCRPSQATRGSACRLVRPSVSTTPGIADDRAGEARLLRHRRLLRGARQSRSPNG